VVFYDLIEKILKKTKSQEFLEEFFKYGSSQLINEKNFGSNFLNVINNHLVYIGSLLKKGEKLKINISFEIFSCVLTKYKLLKYDFNLERFIILSLNLMEKELIETSNGRTCKKEFNSCLNKLLDIILENKDYIYLHLIAFASIKIKSIKNILK